MFSNPKIYNMKLSEVLQEGLKATPKFRRIMKEYGKGDLTDSHGNLVTNPKQAVAIAASESGQAKPKKKYKKKAEEKEI